MQRLRIIAGPNGSGKTTLTKDLVLNYHLNFGIYINADDIERILRKNSKISFSRFDIQINEGELASFFKAHVLRPKAQTDFTIKYNTLYLAGPLPEYTYFGTLLADFIRIALAQSQKTFSFETVMSGSDKLKFIEKAKSLGYRIYLYFICIDKDAQNIPTINFKRVKDRVAKSGHHVPENLIAERYEKTLKNLLPVIRLSDRAYIFDNSGTGYRLIAEVTGGIDIELAPDNIPSWMEEYVLK